MGWLGKEWADIGPQLKYDLYKTVVIGAMGAIVVLATLFMKTIRSIPEPFTYGVLFVVACACFIFLTNRLPKIAEKTTREKPELSQDVPAAGVDTIAKVDEFYRTYDNRMLVEVEDHLRLQSQQYPAGPDREKVLIRQFASFFIFGSFEYNWLLIFRSQIAALETLNQRSEKIEALRRFYDEAVTPENAAFYSNYPYTSWLAYLKGAVFIREDGDVVSITIRGQEFLKYLIHTHRSKETRKN